MTAHIAADKPTITYKLNEEMIITAKPNVVYSRYFIYFIQKYN